MLRSGLCDYYDVNIVVKRTKYFLLAALNDNDKAQKDVALKIKVLFTWCISNNNNILMDKVEHLAIVIPKYNLLENSYNHSMTSRRLWNYYHRNKIDRVDYYASWGKSFKYNKKITKEKRKKENTNTTSTTRKSQRGWSTSITTSTILKRESYYYTEIFE